MAWIEDYISYNRNFPTPHIYKEACALACLSAAVRRKVFLGPWNKPLYPALYVALVGPQGLLYKGGNVTIAKQVVRMADVVPLMPDSGSREALASTLKSYMMPQPKDIDTWEDVMRGAEGALFVGELSDLLGSSQRPDDKLLHWLQSWYDCRPDFEPWEYRTQARWENPENLYQLCVTALFGTTPTYVHKRFPEGCTEEGMGSRVLWVVQGYADSIPSDKPWEWDHEECKALVADLQHINALNGEIKYTPEAWETRQEVVGRWEEELRESENDAISGFLARRHDHLVKIAILHAVANPARRDRLSLMVEDVEYSSRFVDNLTLSLRTLWGQGKRDSATTLALEMQKALENATVLLAGPNGVPERKEGAAVLSQFRSHYTKLHGHALTTKALDVILENEWAYVPPMMLKMAGGKNRKIIFLGERSDGSRLGDA